jgi:hypothetical protein
MNNSVRISKSLLKRIPWDKVWVVIDGDLHPQYVGCTLQLVIDTGIYPGMASKVGF